MLRKLIKKLFYTFPVSADWRERFLKAIRARAATFLFPSQESLNQTNLVQAPSGELTAAAEVDDFYTKYTRQVLDSAEKPEECHIPIITSPYKREPGDAKVIAYYLPQFYPFKENDEWWGKGTTEWNNVSRAVPQYLGHYQPRLPGELGFYDLRLKENLERQIELAKMYGVYGFSFYYYWFDGKRLLDRPLNMFIDQKDLDIPFCLCWANENWSRRFDGTNQEVIMSQPETQESYQQVITDIARYMTDPRYITVDGKKLLIIYRPSLMPNTPEVIQYWRDYCLKAGVGELYIIGVKEVWKELDLLGLGYDACGEFHPGTIYLNCRDMTREIKYASPEFAGQVLDYQDIVLNQRYFEYHLPKLYRAVMPMWDNTARRNQKGMIFEGSTPELYERWLKDVIRETQNNPDLEGNFVFINAWNEWGEGTYLEPDRKFGYAYLQATKNAVEKTRLPKE